MARSQSPYLTGFWYLAAPAARLARGATLAKSMLGVPLLLGRAADGSVFALRDICPHRGMPLRHGRFDGRELACAYHGWRFRPDGGCAAIPSLAPGQELDLGRIKARSYPCREEQGNLWVYFAAEGGSGEAPPPVPRVPEGAGDRPRVSLARVFPCDLDHAAFVHTSWWWKRDARRLRLKEKAFEPAPLGWRMARHPLPAENRIYRLLGRRPTSEITYALPGLRVEHVRGGRHEAVALTALTPCGPDETEVHQSLYWTPAWLGPFAPLLRRLAGTFLDQDRAMVVKQRAGLAHEPALMLIDDADTQAKWFQRIKREWLAAQAEGRAFRNPIEATTLRWRS